MGSNTCLTCSLCGHEHRRVPLARGEKALCVRCSCVLEQGSRLGPDAVLAFSITGLAFAVPSVLLPFISAGKLGDERISFLFTGVGGLWDGGMRALALLVLLCGGLLPLGLLGALALMHASPRLGWRMDPSGPLVRAIHLLGHWAIPEVQVLAVLVALTKLGRVVQVTVGPGFWCYCAAALSLLVAQRGLSFDPPVRPKGTSTAAALALAAGAMLVPANFLPILTTESSGSERSDTLFSGVVGLWSNGLWAVALVVFTASILIPIFKLAGLGWLLLKARQGVSVDSRRSTRLHAAIDFIGRWSMLDVFLAAFLAGLVRFGGFSTVRPRAGIVAFAAAVVLTVLATRAFDPRVLWRSGRASSS